MCIGQTFPDIVVQEDSEIRVVTHAARRWLYENTTINDGTDISGPDSVPKIITVRPHTRQMMEDDGLVVLRKKRPTLPFRYHSNPSRLTKRKVSTVSEDEYDGHRARFEGLAVEEYCKRIRTSKGISRWQANNYQRMQEAAEKRKALRDNQLDS